MINRVEPGVLRQRVPSGTGVGLVVDSPHSGRTYPADFGYQCSLRDLRSAEDAYVDELCGAVPAVGGSLLMADFPRAYIDCNRDEHDLNPALIDGTPRSVLKPGPKSSMGIGLVRERLANGESIYARLLTAEELEHRLRTYYRPYHRALTELLNGHVRKAGRVWHVDMHSMASHASSVTPDSGGLREYDMVLGNLDGTSCEPQLIELVDDTLRKLGYRVRINDPYKGAEITRRYGRPEQGVHTLQIEMNRALYLDEQNTEKTAGFAALEKSLSHLFRVLASKAPTIQENSG